MIACLTVGAVAASAGVTTRTVRYYETLGLLPEATRGENGYRYYTPEAVNRLSFIRRAKVLGLTLDEIGSLMALSDEGACDVISPELHRVLERKIGECNRQIAEIEAFRSTLATAAARLAPCAEEVSVAVCSGCSAYAAECECLPAQVPISLTSTT